MNSGSCAHRPGNDRVRRPWAVLAVAAALVALGATGCTAGAARNPDGIEIGRVLGGSGFQGVSTIVVYRAHEGHTYRFAFPELANLSTTPLTVLGYRFATVPAGMTAGAVHVYDVNESRGTVLTYRDGQDAGTGLATFPDHVHEVLTLQPKQISTRYAMISVRLRQATDTPVSGCVVRYRQAGRIYEQTLRCSYALSGRSGP